MIRCLSLLVVPILVFGCAHRKSPQTITANTDSDEKFHPAEVRLSGGATVTCVSASGKNGSPAKCNINGASVAPPDNVTATDKVYLLCEGTAPLTCTAKVE